MITPPPPRPNPDVLLIYTDQWRWDALSCLGSQAQTPVLDALAAEGVHFDHAVVQSPVCMPSQASLFTGQYPSTLGITEMGVPVPEDTETLATVLAARGYRTANIGRLHFLPHANRDHASPHPRYGFDTLALSDEPGVYEDDYRAWVRAQDPEALVGSVSSSRRPRRSGSRRWGSRSTANTCAQGLATTTRGLTSSAPTRASPTPRGSPPGPLNTSNRWHRAGRRSPSPASSPPNALPRTAGVPGSLRPLGTVPADALGFRS